MKFRRFGRRSMLAGAAASLGAAAAPPGQTIAIAMVDGRALVPVMLDGGLAQMVLDTGAERSLITRVTATRLRLRFDPWVETTLRGAGGRLETHPNADVQRAMLGGIPLFQRPETAGLSLAVTELALGGADGLLGGDVLRHFTLELDCRARQMALRPGWTPPGAGAIPLTLLWPDLLLAPVRLDGQALTGLVDTGAGRSLVNARGLRRFGLTPSILAHDAPGEAAAIGGSLAVRLHRFAELRLGALGVQAPELLAAFVPEPAFDMILGMDVLGLQKLRISYASRRLAIGD